MKIKVAEDNKIYEKNLQDVIHKYQQEINYLKDQLTELKLQKE